MSTGLGIDDAKNWCRTRCRLHIISRPSDVLYNLCNRHDGIRPRDDGIEIGSTHDDLQVQQGPWPRSCERKWEPAVKPAPEKVL